MPSEPKRYQERKIQTNLRLTPTARLYIARLAARLGVSHADVVELAVRYFAEAHEVADKH